MFIILFLLCLCAEVEGDYYGKHGHEQFCRNNPHDAQVAEYQAQQDRDDGLHGEQFANSFFHNIDLLSSDEKSY